MGIKQSLLIIFFFAASSASLLAQSVIEHEIVQGNTIYGLAKEYGSTVEAIYEANPNIGIRTLVIGETVIIPIPKKEIVDSSRYTFHQVRSFESVYSIANKYHLKDSTIFWHNPVLKGSAILQKDQIIRIPKNPDGWKEKSGEFESLKPNEHPRYEVYLVKKSDKAELLWEDWGLLSIDEFYSLNPDARENWYTGMALVKPINKAAAQYQYSITDLNAVDTTTSKSDTITVACILPFFLDQYINEGPGKKRSELAFSYRQGIELALREVSKDSSLHLSMAYFDSMNQMDTVRHIIDQLHALEPDLILGPMYSSRLMQLSGTPFEHVAVNLISKQDVVRITNMWNDVVSEEAFTFSIKDDFVKRMAIARVDTQSLQKRRLLVAGINFGKSAAVTRALIKDLNDQDYLVVEGDNSWIHNEQLATLDSSVVYDLVITENDPAYILDVLRNLRSTTVKYHWYTHEYQALDNGLVSSVFARENVTMYTSNYTDYQRIEVVEFIAKFREEFGRNPDQMAMEAYDNAMFHFLRLTNSTMHWRGVRKGFRFTTESKENTFVEVRKFNHLQWQLVP